MKSRAILVPWGLTVVLAMLGGCGTVEYRSASAPIEVIESNYIESTNDAEIVQGDEDSDSRVVLLETSVRA